MRRRCWWSSVAGMAVWLSAAGSAAAQGTTLQLSPESASPGQVVTVTGGGFGTAAGDSPVALRLSTRDAEPLSSPAVDSRGNLSNGTFIVPPGTAPGTYLVLATQTYANGRQRAFTPGRARLQVVAPRSAAAGAPGGGGGPSPLVPALIALSLALLAGGSLAARRRLALIRQAGS